MLFAKGSSENTGLSTDLQQAKLQGKNLISFSSLTLSDEGCASPLLYIILVLLCKALVSIINTKYLKYADDFQMTDRLSAPIPCVALRNALNDII